MQESAAQVQREIDAHDHAIAVYSAKKRAAEAKLAEIERVNKARMQVDRERLDAALHFFLTFQASLSNRHPEEVRAKEACQAFLDFVQTEKEELKNIHVLARSASLLESLARSSQETPTNFEKIDRQYRAIERYAHCLEGGKPMRRKLGLAMRSAGGALLVLGVFAAASLTILAVFFPPAILILIGVGALAAGLFGVHMRSTGKNEILASERAGLPQKMLLFGDALKDKADRRLPNQISMFEDYRRRWFR